MEYEVVIGLEIHAQLLTRSKMFCGDSAEYADAPPNTHVCPVCLGMPGVLPVINRTAIEYAVMTALALNCEIAEFTRFDRKNYFYPDLMKDYQISQYDMPLSHDGWMSVEMADQTRAMDAPNGASPAESTERKIVRIKRVHMEEDTARLLHRVDALGETYSLVDINRAGAPLMEIVTEPDLRSPEEAQQFLMQLRSILRYLGVSTGNMEEGSFRCDANISVRPRGSTELGEKVEVKNMNSFRAVFRALRYEAERQIEAQQTGGRIVQETRGWVEDKSITVSQRSKEYAHDYRYFPEPDLPPLVFSREWVEKLRRGLPELPDAKRERYMREFGLSVYDATLLTEARPVAEFFEECMRQVTGTANVPAMAKAVSNWMLGDFRRLLNETGTEITASRVSPAHLVGMIEMVDAGQISGKIAKTVFEEMFASGKRAGDVVAERGLTQISDVSELEQVLSQILDANPQAVEDYFRGKTQSLTYLVGQTMKATRGKADPALTNRLLRELLEKRRSA
ncbi:MAG: Asp-tRNA(Asn)/Glu-tRNA(Gln) amidotransferase subunit GatB [Chloroflexota bacterium]|nr:MAG: Asp-tRNA(Asn)/Glu-tRNA(Gln) amidotransferase subunit GatB [Chloroflexota bacterium]